MEECQRYEFEENFVKYFSYIIIFVVKCFAYVAYFIKVELSLPLPLPMAMITAMKVAII